MLESRHIKTFLEVVRSGSYSAAARSLGYTQPAITQQMKALEREVGMPLFTRMGRGLQLTEAGTALARHAEIIVSDLAAAHNQLRALAKLESGLVRLCAFPSANATFVPRAAANLLADHPGIRVELQEAEPPESLWRLNRGECDIALAFTYQESHAEPSAEVVRIALMEDLLTVLLPAGHPLARHHSVRLGDLAEERWIAGCPRCRANLLHLCAEENFVPDIVFTTDDNLAVQSLVAAGVGVALMPALVLSFLCHPEVTGRVLAGRPTRRVSAFVLADHRRVPAVGLVLDELETAAAARIGC
ncbi:LysR family transcriptional regulator [Nocardia transvalensis]|uniref:LysR family transcriptional regulator n=1 Tax=Nocardia transvalensis TaxID=37333 RepID=UPI001895AC06|nr:LysR family transcriptional regulator [Nocardia transvalensis]MBF6331989.1 LysR family transcriptional regulator [Nocardia transvalensis]